MSLGVMLSHAVEGFDLDVAWRIEDEFAVLFGYSGSGKSMTMQMLAGLVRPNAGRITCDGQVLFDSASRIEVPARMRPFGYVTQGCTLFPHMSVRRNIEYALKGVKRSERAEQTAEVIEALRLKDLQDKRPGELSGGQKQRAQLARTLVRRPRVLLLDEPFTALDAPIRAEMREVVRHVHRRFRVPVVMVTHDLYEAYTMADTMVVYSGGRVVQAGSPCELFNRPAAPEIEALLTSERLFSL
ncbi:MAG: ABC transporter ATP-binding protein [Coriobacteriia bacterium]